MSRPVFELVPVGKLTVDVAYQRDPSPRMVAQIAEHFDIRALGVLEVSRRLDGSLAVLDGQTRLMALRAMAWSEEEVPCLVHEGLSQSIEAALFMSLNFSRPLDKRSAFRARLVKGDPDALAIQSVLGDFGLVLGGQGHAEFAAIIAADSVYREGVLRRTLVVIQEAWPRGTALMFSAPVLQGLGAFLSYPGWRAELDQARLVTTLQDVTPRQLLTAAKERRLGFSAGTRGSVKAFITVVLDHYNKGLRANRLSTPSLDRPGALRSGPRQEVTRG